MLERYLFSLRMHRDEPRHARAAVIRRFDRFYRKHPNIAFACMVVACAVVLYIAYQDDGQNSASLYWQMAAQQRSST